MTWKSGFWIAAAVIVILVLVIIFQPRIGYREIGIVQDETPSTVVPEQAVSQVPVPASLDTDEKVSDQDEAEVESEPESELTVSPEATDQIMVPVQQVTARQETSVVAVTLADYVANEVAAQVAPLKKKVAAAEARNQKLTEALQQPALTVMPKPEATVVTTMAPTAPVSTTSTLVPVTEKPVASGPTKLVAYWQGGKTYVSLDAVKGDPPYYRFGGTKIGGWSLDKTPLYPDNGWLVLNGEFNWFQIVSLYPDGSVQYWSQICETFWPSDQGVYIADGDCLYSPVRR